jgi:site-specific DNA recombinase
MKKVGIYLRVSTEEQARIQDGSLVSQRQRAIEYIEGQNRRDDSWGRLIEVYADEGKSAKDMNRPEFQRLLNDIRSGQIDLILSTELSRLSRSIQDFCELWALFKKHGVSLVTLREQFDTTTASGEMMIFNLINFAQYERKQTAERISANWMSRAKRGLWNGGSIPFGFDRNPAKKSELLPHATESLQVKEIFDLFLEVGSVRKTCLELTKRGIFSKRYTNKHGVEKGARQITLPSLQRILTNRAYIGIREIGVKDKKLELVPASWKPLISVELFTQVQERLALNKNKYKPDEWKRHSFPLTELLFCGECGKHLGGKSGTSKTKDKHFYYGHPRQLNSDGVTHLKRCRLENVRAEKIEDVLLKSLKSIITDEKLLDHWLDIYTKGTETNRPAVLGKIKSMETDIQTLTRRNENLIERLSELPKEISADGIYKQIQTNAEKVKELTSTLESLKSQDLKLATQTVNREGLLFKIKRTIQNLEKTPEEQRRGVYSNLIKFAELHPTKIRLGVYAPTEPSGKSQTLEMKKAAGEFPAAVSNLGNVSNREGSCTVTFGAQDKTRTCTSCDSRP